MSEEEQVLLRLMSRYDTKIASHIGAIIAITFGSFTILTFLRGAGFPPETWSGKYLLMVEIMLIVSSCYCVIRAMHYSAMAEILKGKSNRLRDLENRAYDDACAEMPSFTRWVFNFRKNKLSRTRLLLLGFVGLMLWFFVVIAVLTLP